MDEQSGSFKLQTLNDFKRKISAASVSHIEAFQFQRYAIQMQASMQSGLTFLGRMNRTVPTSAVEAAAVRANGFSTNFVIK